MSVALLLGAGAGWGTFGSWPLAVVGTLAGFLVGRTFAGIWFPEEDEGRVPKCLSPAGWSLILSIGGWVAALFVWTFIVATGFLRGEGASLLFLFFVLPLTTVCWSIAGPTASSVARQALRQIAAGTRPASDRSPARMALTLSRLMNFTFWGFLIWLLIALAG